MSQLESTGENFSGPDEVVEIVEVDEVARPMREGLPPSYRMRADSHYVDLLTSRPIAGRERLIPPCDIESPPLAELAAIRSLVESVSQVGVLQPLLVQQRQGKYRLIAGHKRLSAATAAGLVEVPCRLYDVGDDEAKRLASAAAVAGDPSEVARASVREPATPGVEGDIEHSLGSLNACVDLLSSPGSDLSRGIAQSLLRAEIWRTQGLVRAAQIIRQDAPAGRMSVPVSRLIDVLHAGYAAERRLRGFDIAVKSTLPADAVIVTDERLLQIGLSSAVRAILDLAGDTPGTVKIAVSADGVSQVTFTVSQNAVSATDTWIARAFDANWVDRPGGRAALVTLLAVRQAAALLGGRAQAQTAGRGTAIALTIPAGLHDGPAVGPRL